MHELTEMIRRDMTEALGVTEPGAIAFCAAKARSLIGGELIELRLDMNSGMYKNACTCCIPNSDGFGSVHAAALGFAAGNAEKGLLALEDVTPGDDALARRYAAEGKVRTALKEMSSRIFIEARLRTTAGSASVTIRDAHTRIARMTVNGETVMEAPPLPDGEAPGDRGCVIHDYSFDSLAEYVRTVPYREIAFVLDAHRVNMELFEAGLRSPKGRFAALLLAANGGRVFSEDEGRTASLLCGGAVEARVMGVPKPAMGITGSGAHGIIATLPLYAVYRIRHLTEEELCRATMLSFLVCTYIKEYSGRLSAFCGCGIAAGTGMALGLCLMKGGGQKETVLALNNMAASITGMICDGGNQGCVMKSVAACSAAFDSARFALGGVGVDPIHGIIGRTPEETMRNMGRIASPGMTRTEETIVGIQAEKQMEKA